MTANVKISQILLKRGNTSAASSYTGPLGEVVIDTGLNTLRIQDGITPGGQLITASGDGNVNLTNYTTLPQLTANINTVNSKITGANAAIVTANTAMKGYVDAVTTAWLANAVSQQSDLSSLRANITAANTAIATKTTTTYVDSAISTAINNLINSAPGTLDTLGEISANLASQSSSVGAIVNSITSTNANVTAANTAIVTANTAMKGYVDAVTTAWTANASTQHVSINALQANVGSFYTWANLNYGTNSYANANVASYLPTYTGNISGISFADGNLNLGGIQTPFNQAGTIYNVKGIIGMTSSSGANISGFNSVSALTFRAERYQYSNGVSILDGVAGAYSNVNVEAYLAGNVTTGNLTVTQNAVILGNLQVVGTQTTVNTTTLTVNDLFVTVANGAIDSSQANGAGLRVAGALANISYSSVTDSFEFNKPIASDTVTASTTLKTNLINNTGSNQQITIDPDNTNLAYIKIGGFDDGGERVSISNQFTNSAGIYFYTETGTFRMYQDQFKFADDTWQSTAWTGTVANLTLGANVVSLGIDGNITLPNNMIFTSSPAISGTGIIFGDSTYQHTAWTGRVDSLKNEIHNATLDSTGNLTVPGSILPNADNVYDLGSANMRFRHLYVGPGTVYVGNAAIKTTVTGNLILPGITRAVASSAFVEEVEETGDQSYSFATNPTIIDNAQFELLSGGSVSSFTPATYSSVGIDNDGYIRNITVDTAGAGYADDVADLAEQDMWATEAADPVNNFNINDWIQIPFRAETRAGESEYEFNTGDSASDRLTNNGNEAILDSDGDLTLPGAVLIGSSDGSIARDGDDLVISWDNESLILKSVSDHVEVEADNDFKISVRNDGNDYTGKWLFTQDNELVNISADTGIVSEGGELRLQGGRDTLSSANVKIVSVNNGVAIHNWTFATTGNIVFPDGTEQSTAYTGGGGGNANTGNVIFDGDTLYVGGVGFLDLDNSDNQIEIGSNNNGPVIVSVNEGANRWEFGANGRLTAPGDITTGANGGRFVQDCSDGDTSMRWINIDQGVGSSTEIIRVYTGDSGAERAQVEINWLDNDRSGLTVKSFDRTNPDNIVRHNWQFLGNAGLQFPDETVQVTAYTGQTVSQENLMLDGGAAATVYEVTVDYAEGGFSSTRYGVNTPSFNGGGAALDEDIYYTLDGGGA